MQRDKDAADLRKKMGTKQLDEFLNKIEKGDVPGQDNDQKPDKSFVGFKRKRAKPRKYQDLTTIKITDLSQFEDLKNLKIEDLESRNKQGLERMEKLFSDAVTLYDNTEGYGKTQMKKELDGVKIPVLKKFKSKTYGEVWRETLDSFKGKKFALTAMYGKLCKKLRETDLILEQKRKVILAVSFTYKAKTMDGFGLGEP